MVDKKSKPSFIIYLRGLPSYIPSITLMATQCLKITEKVSFNNASEASYIYILSGQNLIKMPKIIHLKEFLKT